MASQSLCGGALEELPIIHILHGKFPCLLGLRVGHAVECRTIEEERRANILVNDATKCVAPNFDRRLVGQQILV